MKKFVWIVMLMACFITTSIYAQQAKNSYVGSIGYQTEFQRFGIQLQGRYQLCSVARLAPDVTFFFPKNQVSGLDINLNLHYLIPVKKLTLYPLVGIGLQTNFYGNSSIINEPDGLHTLNETGSHFALNLGGGLSYPLSDKCYLNAESKFMVGYKHNMNFMIGIGHTF